MTVQILLATLNGERFLDAQLRSLLDQTHADWQLFSSDDGSTDGTLALLQRFQSSHPNRVRRPRRGPGKGHAANFFALLAACDPDRMAAFCDQDDIWLPLKLQRAFDALEHHGDVPALYCSARSVFVDGARPHATDGPKNCRPSFANALIQNIASGNTIVMTAAAVRVMQQALGIIGVRGGPVKHHDWFCYQIITGVGGQVVFDHHPSLLYRQHARNLIGANVSIRARVTRAAAVMQHDHRRKTDGQVAGLVRCKHMLTPPHQKLLQGFVSAREKPLVPRLSGLAAVQVHRQSALGTASMWAAAALRRL